MSWTERDTEGVRVILVELKGLIERHPHEFTTDLHLREQQAEHDVDVLIRMLGGT